MAYGAKNREQEKDQDIPWAMRMIANQLGFKDPKEFFAIVENFKTEIPDVAIKMKEMMDRVAHAMTEMNGRLARIELHLGVSQTTTPAKGNGHDRSDTGSETEPHRAESGLGRSAITDQRA